MSTAKLGGLAPDRLAGIAVGNPVLQIAADGQWETAEVVAIADGLADVSSLVEQVRISARKDIAVELMWPGEIFVGARWAANRWREATTVIFRTYDVMTHGGVRDQHSARATLLALAGQASNADVEFVELGAVNVWRSIGPELLWRGELLTQDVCDAKLRRRSDLTTCTHPLAVEFAVTEPQNCWVAPFVSSFSEKFCHLDRPALARILGQVTEVALT